MLEVKDISYSYGQVKVLEGISLEVEEGTITSVFGANGAGKTTLVKNLAGSLFPNKGKIIFKGRDVTDLPSYKRNEMGIALIPERRRNFPNLSVIENLRSGAYSKEAREKLEDSLEMVFDLFPILQERENQLISSMSGGEQQMVTLGRGLMSSPSLLILDEPTLGIQPNISSEIMRKLKEISKEGITILLAAQRVNLALEVIDRGYILETGTIAFRGTAEEIRSSSKLREAYLGG